VPDSESMSLNSDSGSEASGELDDFDSFLLSMMDGPLDVSITSGIESAVADFKEDQEISDPLFFEFKPLDTMSHCKVEALIPSPVHEKRSTGVKTPVTKASAAVMPPKRRKHSTQAKARGKSPCSMGEKGKGHFLHRRPEFKATSVLPDQGLGESVDERIYSPPDLKIFRCAESAELAALNWSRRMIGTELADRMVTKIPVRSTRTTVSRNEPVSSDVLLDDIEGNEVHETLWDLPKHLKIGYETSDQSHPSVKTSSDHQAVTVNPAQSVEENTEARTAPEESRQTSQEIDANQWCVICGKVKTSTCLDENQPGYGLTENRKPKPLVLGPYRKLEEKLFFCSTVPCWDAPLWFREIAAAYVTRQNMVVFPSSKCAKVRRPPLLPPPHELETSWLGTPGVGLQRSATLSPQDIDRTWRCEVLDPDGQSELISFSPKVEEGAGSPPMGLRKDDYKVSLVSSASAFEFLGNLSVPGNVWTGVRHDISAHLVDEDNPPFSGAEDEFTQSESETLD